MALVPGARERACAALAGRVLVPEHEAEATVAAAGIDLTLLLSGRAFVRAASNRRRAAWALLWRPRAAGIDLDVDAGCGGARRRARRYWERP